MLDTVDLAGAVVTAVGLLDPDGDIVRNLATSGRGRRHPGWACYHTDMWTADVDGVDVGVVGLAVGAPFAGLVAEQLAACGAELVISITSAGQIAPNERLPCFLLIDRALRDEGTSTHYLPEPVLTGASWATDAPYRETAAALYAYATARQQHGGRAAVAPGRGTPRAPGVPVLHVEGITGAKAGVLNWARPHLDPRTELVALVDADYQVDPRWLADLVPYFDDPEVGFVQCPHAYRDHEHSAYGRMVTARYDRHVTDHLSSNEHNASTAIGTMSLIRLATIDGPAAGRSGARPRTRNSRSAHAAGYSSHFVNRPHRVQGTRPPVPTRPAALLASMVALLLGQRVLRWLTLRLSIGVSFAQYRRSRWGSPRAVSGRRSRLRWPSPWRRHLAARIVVRSAGGHLRHRPPAGRVG